MPNLVKNFSAGESQVNQSVPEHKFPSVKNYCMEDLCRYEC